MNEYNIKSSPMEIRKDVKDLMKEYPGLTPYEAMDIILKMEQLKLLQRAFVVSGVRDEATALEKIAMILEDRS